VAEKGGKIKPSQTPLGGDGALTAAKGPLQRMVPMFAVAMVVASIPPRRPNSGEIGPPAGGRGRAPKAKLLSSRMQDAHESEHNKN